MSTTPTTPQPTTHLHVTKRELVIASVIFVVAAIFFVQWISERDSRIKAEEQSKAAAQLEKEREADIQRLERDKQQRDAQTASQIAALQAQIANIRTPQQAAQIIPQYIPMPQGQVAGPLQEITSTSPTFKPGDFILPKEDALPLAQQLNKCKQDQASLGTCTADLADTNSQLEARSKQFKLAQEDADRWKKVAKGGSAWQRTFRIVKWAGCAAGGALIGDKVGGRNGAAVGGASGVVGCALVLK